MPAMDQKTKELWVIPSVIALATGIILGFLFLFLTAWATGVQLRSSFTFGWLKALLSVQMPLWTILLIAAVAAAVLLYSRQRAQKKSDIALSFAGVDAKREEQEPKSAPIPPAPPAAYPLNGEDHVHRITVCYIMYGEDRLLAYTTTREGLPGTRFLVVRNRPGQQPQSCETADRAVANDRWNEWYQEWKKKGFGGTSGNGLDGEPPF